MFNMASQTFRAGFTMVEVIAVLMLLGIIGVFGSFFLVNMVKSYQWAEDNSHLAQKAQVAITRLAVEMSYTTSPVQIDEDNNTIIYNAIYPGGETVSGNSIERNGNGLDIIINGANYTLTDRVAGFDLEHGEGNNYFTVTLTMMGANDVPKVFEKSISLP